MLTKANYCRACNAALILHADGSLACACDFLDAGNSAIPDTWELTLPQLLAARHAERKQC